VQLGTQQAGAFRRFSLERARALSEYTGKTPLYAVKCAVSARATARILRRSDLLDRTDRSERGQAEPSRPISATAERELLLTAPNPSSANVNSID